MKKIVLIIFYFWLMQVFAFAQSTTIHVVQRGETVASIAKKYGISEEELKKANPDINDYFYAGMKLVIPKKEKSIANSPSDSKSLISQDKSKVSKNNSSSHTVARKSLFIETEHPKSNNGMSWGASLDGYGGFSTFEWNEGTPKSGVGFGVGVSGQLFWKGDYNPDGYFVEMGAGYTRKGSGAYPMDYISAKVLPLSYSFGENSVFFKGGMYLGLPLSKVKTQNNSFDGNFDYGIVLGVGYFVNDQFATMFSIEEGLAKVCNADVELKNRVVFFTLSYRIK